MDATAYAHEAGEFLAAIELEYHQTGAGLKPTLETSPIYARHAHLFGEDAVRSLVDGRDTDEIRPLASFALDGYLESGVSALTDAIANAELAATLEWNGAHVPYLQVPTLIMNEDNPEQRGELARRYYAKMAETNPLRVRRWNQIHSAVRSLGFDYVAACDEVKGLDLHRLAEQVAWVLDVTERPFETELNSRLAAREVPRDGAALEDVESLLRAKDLDPLFPPEKMLPALRQTLAGLGIDLDTRDIVLPDTEARPLKPPRTFCSAVRAPDGVRLAIRPAGGVGGYAALLHAAGLLEHDAHAGPEAARACRGLGDPSVGESYGFLFESLLSSPAWLEEVLGLLPGQIGEALPALHLALLWTARRLAAKLNYEIELHAGLVDAKASAYAYWLHRGCRVQIPPQRFLEDVDDGFQVAHSLRALLFATNLRAHLERAYGPGWFAHREAGALLGGVWSAGRQVPVEDLGRQVGVASLDLAPLVKLLTA